ncbi:hypothetical protein G6M78_20625 [Agrobacterium tumefaciens]|uniref:Mov34/MPN/PAD-1 family protein n=1 Tax=Agrobacterium tumefaciens TaxID=358 RepID=UPI001574BB45|nr:Mov34/MPN/PAD-1 family protein [Agrobacterium tumefaciens]NTE57470.1 hypothetical protein [Agrobacterium tumefaciens]NTE69964.1 hypothetical protein [Agrobacterium tumefaciens]
MQPDMIFAMGLKAYVLLPARVLAIMQSFVVGDEGQREAGGILIGSHRGDHIEIRDCTVPLKSDVRKRFLFDRKDRGHQKAATIAWNSSGGTETFVGEWHSHPEDYPRPSSLDCGTWRDITMRENRKVIFLIVGRKELWAGWGRTGVIERIYPVI